jgi:hypothetical protein
MKRMEVCCIYTYEDSITHQILFERGEEGELAYNGGSELVQGTLYACMELSQWNPLILLIYDKSKIKIKRFSVIKNK